MVPLLIAAMPLITKALESMEASKAASDKDLADSKEAKDKRVKAEISSIGKDPKNEIDFREKV